MAENYDLIVIGGGPGGYSAAIAAGKNKLRTALFETQRLGGTCLNEGCIPTKFLLEKAAALDKIRKLTSQGIFKEAGVYSFKKIQSEKELVVRRLTDGVAYLLKNSGVDVFNEQAELKPGRVVRANGRDYSAKNIIIATGSQPAKIPIPGAELTIDSTAALSLMRVPKNLSVIGAGVIGLELASAFASFGAKVTILEVVENLLPGEEGNATKRLAREIQKSNIEIVLGAKVGSITKTDNGLRVTYSSRENQKQIETDQVLMAVGRKPRLSGIDAEALGLELTPRGFISVDRQMRTNLSNVYAIGDVAGGYQLAHAAFAEAEVAVQNISGKTTSYDDSAIPRCIYTIPAFAAVGTTTQKAKEAGIEVTTGSFPYEANGMALADDASGVVCVIMEKKSQKTIGVQIIGEGAPEMIALATAAVAKGFTFEDWERLIIAHPSLSEMLKEAALDCFGQAIHK